MNERIMRVRKTLKLTQEKFAKAIGLSQNFVWMIEKGERIPSERTITDICRTFNVSYQWLTTGQGEMFLKPSDVTIDALINAYNLDEVDKEILSAYIQMDKQEREALKSFIKTLIKK